MLVLGGKTGPNSPNGKARRPLSTLVLLAHLAAALPPVTSGSTVPGSGELPLPPPARRICRPGPINPPAAQQAAANDAEAMPRRKPKCNTRANFQYNGTRVGKPATGGTAAQCCAMCAAVGQCRHWTWHPVGKSGQPSTCFLNKDDGVFRPNPPSNGFVAGSVTQHTRLKNVLIIGDSISLGAMGDLTMDLAGIASVEHAPFSSDGGALDSKYAMDTADAMVGANSGPPWVNPSSLPSGHGRYGDGCLNGTFLVSSTQQPSTYDVISFNYGVHDVDYSAYHEEYVPLQLYETNIRAIKATLQATGAKVVFAASTPVQYNLTTNNRILAMNKVAKQVMAEPPTASFNDLYATITDVCGQPPYNTPYYKNAPNCSISDYKGVHYQAGGWQLLANATGRAIRDLLKVDEVEEREVLDGSARSSGAITCDAPTLLAAAWALHSVTDDVKIRGHHFDAEAWSLPKNPDGMGPTSCPANSTCMVTAFSSTGMGCCIGHGTQAVACPDHVHCCPTGWSCTETCRLGGCGCVPP